MMVVTVLRGFTRLTILRLDLLCGLVLLSLSQYSRYSTFSALWLECRFRTAIAGFDRDSPTSCSFSIHHGNYKIQTIEVSRSKGVLIKWVGVVGYLIDYEKDGWKDGRLGWLNFPQI